MTDVQDIQRRIVELDVEHRDLDAVIAVLTADGHADQLQLRRLKTELETRTETRRARATLKALWPRPTRPASC